MREIKLTFPDGGIKIEGNFSKSNLLEALTVLSATAKEKGIPEELIYISGIVGSDSDLMNKFAVQSTDIGGGVAISNELEKILKDLKG